MGLIDRLRRRFHWQGRLNDARIRLRAVEARAAGIDARLEGAIKTADERHATLSDNLAHDSRILASLVRCTGCGGVFTANAPKLKFWEREKDGGTEVLIACRYCARTMELKLPPGFHEPKPKEKPAVEEKTA